MADEARLAQRAIGGDGDAFAELYSAYEGRAYNLCLRILGSEDDAADATQEAFVSVLRRLPKLEGRDLAFGSYVLTAARNACYDLIERRKRAEPTGEPPEPAFGEPVDPGDDPLRNLMLEASQNEIRSANALLPERHREVLALRELEELSYDEIAAIMGMNRNSVAQLISRARIGLRDALRGTALATIAVSSADCERALALMAARQDDEGGVDSVWLDLHLLECDTCRLSREAMEEAGVSYRSWIPVAAAPLLFRDTMAYAAEAAEEAGTDWRPPGERRRGRFRQSRARDLVLASALTVVLFFVVFAARTHEDPVGDVLPAAEAEAPTAPGLPNNAAKPSEQRAKRRKAGNGRDRRTAPAPPIGVAPIAETVEVLGVTETSAPRERRGTADRDGGSQGDRVASDTPAGPGPAEPPPFGPGPQPQPQPQPQPPAQPQPQPEPPREEPPPTEEEPPPGGEDPPREEEPPNCPARQCEPPTRAE